MNISRKIWVILITLAIASSMVWIKFSYPELAFSDYSVGRNQAYNIAASHLTNRGYNISSYQSSVVFKKDRDANRFLQKILGFEGLKNFVIKENFDLFYWSVRFFQAGQKEEFRVLISSSSGDVIGFTHIIDDESKRPENSKENALDIIQSFYKETFNIDFDQYILKTDSSKKYDNRTNYYFRWEKKNVQIPWNDTPDSGTGKLFISGTVTGTEILNFNKSVFSVPKQFERDIAKKNDFNNTLGTILGTIYLLLLVAAIYYILVRKNHLSMQLTKKFYLSLLGFCIFIGLLSSINDFEYVLAAYNTTIPFDSYLGRYWFDLCKGLFFGTLVIIIPSLAGELIHYEVFKNKPYGSFLHNVRSNFLNHSVAKQIFIGYIVFLIVLGLQTIITKIGVSYAGVWTERNLLSDLSTSYIPIIAAIHLGIVASLSEELMYRLFTISLGKKILKSTTTAVIFSAVIWGFSHTSYPVFPMWFRGIEVTCIGIFLGIIYLRFGLISVIIAHYMFNVFWATAGYIFSESLAIYQWSAIISLLIPIFYALLCLIVNKGEEARPMKWSLNQHQKYNLDILKSYITQNIQNKDKQTYNDLRLEIISHGWDPAVVETALEESGINPENK